MKLLLHNRKDGHLDNIVVKCDLDFIKCEYLSSVGNKYRVMIDFNLAPKKETVTSQISVRTPAGTDTTHHVGTHKSACSEVLTW
jgi:hypothetical protein